MQPPPLVPAVRATVDGVLGAGVRGGERQRFWCRVEHLAPGARELLAALYPGHDLDRLTERVLAVVAGGLRARRRGLRELDARREVDPLWFQSNDQIGYVAYAERFGGTLNGVRGHLDHLESLHVTYLHLMHVLRARDGENDGGYAIVDYTDVEPRLGSRRDLQRLADDLHARDISLCLDVVMNHTAREHPWAAAAREGSAHHRAMYHVFADRTLPDQYERTLPEVFPEVAPGSFTFDDAMQAWVWTSFYDYQWDLNYANPDVFVEMLQVMLDLANVGVDVLRLDAIAFTWKRMGTNCQNQPEAHLLAQLFRSCLGMAAPGVVLKAEAIVAPTDLVPYLGAHRDERDECHLAYHNQLMVMLWSSLAAGDAGLATESLARLPPTPRHASWTTYLRCHDDIGWAVDDDVAARLSISGPLHRRYLAEFYRGDAPGSFARGAAFSSNPIAGDERSCGTAASLAGIESAFDAGDAGDAEALELAVRRLLLGYAVVFSFGGTPLVYMGDEIAMVNDWSYLDDPVLRDDSRWVHRPFMDWAAVTAATGAVGRGSVAARVLEAMRAMAAVRRTTPAMSTGGELWMHRLDQPTLLAWERRHPRHGRFYGIANVGTRSVSIDRQVLAWAGLVEPVELLGDDGVAIDGAWLRLGPLSVGWFVDALDGGVQPAPPAVAATTR